MRKCIKKLVEKSDCIVRTKKGKFLFYLDLEKDYYVELGNTVSYINRPYKKTMFDKEDGIRKIVLDSEIEELEAMKKDGSVIFEDEFCLYDRTRYEALMDSVIRKRTSEKLTITKYSNTNTIRQYYERELKKIRTKLNEIDAIITDIERQTIQLGSCLSPSETRK